MTTGVRRRHSPDERGLTLIEVLVTVAILGIAFVTVVGGMAVSIAGSDMHRKQATSQTVLRNLAEFMKGAEYQCSGDYTAAMLDFTGTRLPSSVSTPADPAHTAFADPEQALLIDERPTPREAAATLNAASPTASIRLLFGSEDIPAETDITGAHVNVRHRQGGDATNLSISVVVTPDGGSPLPPQEIPTDNTTLAEDRIDLRSEALGLDTPEELEVGMTVDVTATVAAGASEATVFIDGVDLAISPQSHPVTRLATRPGPTTATYTVDLTDDQGQPGLAEQWNSSAQTSTTSTSGPTLIEFGAAPACEEADTGLQQLRLQVQSVARAGLEPEAILVVKRKS